MQGRVNIDIYRNVGARFKDELIDTMRKGFKELHKELLHALDQISADLERCTATEEIKADPDLKDYRLRISKELEPLKVKVSLLAGDLPVENDMVVKPKNQNKRMAAIKELKGESKATKKKKA